MIAGMLVLMPQMAAHAQGYPVKPIRLIVPYPPGGGNDLSGRMIAQKLAVALRQQVIIDNRSGASGIVGAELGARAAPDGYTLLLAGAALMAMNPALLSRLPYDPIRDFAPVSLTGSTPFMLVTNPALPVKSVQDLVALARTKPGQLNYASAGAGGPARLAAELLKSMTKIDMVHVPYNGGGPALTATVAGETQLIFNTIGAVSALVKDGRLRGIAVTSLKRSAAAPELPTVAESGVPGYEISNWFSIVVPAATPPAVIARLNADIVKTVNLPDIRTRFAELGLDPLGSTPQEQLAYTRSEIAKWAKVVKAAGIPIE
jgi:tripartite-type tricarboxylate transporter receptor subunit TctC